MTLIHGISYSLDAMLNSFTWQKHSKLFRLYADVLSFGSQKAASHIMTSHPLRITKVSGCN